MTIPSLQEAWTLLAEGETRFPGPWVSHSKHAATAARAIAERHPDLDGGTAFILGLLHDIGRRGGVAGMRHVLDGYRSMMDAGYAEVARISLTHSFPVQQVEAIEGHWDCTSQELDTLRELLAGVTYTDYDRLIQLCDALALPEGICLIEKRFVHVAMRYGMTAYTRPRWKAYLQIQADFEQVLGCSIYDLLPGVAETSFGVSLLALEEVHAPHA